MTDTEIIKALECCQQNTVCVECPMWKKGQNCIEKMCGYALDLINRLQADKEALIAGQETLQKALAEKAAEVERLKNDCFCISNERDAIGDCLNEAVEEAKAEVIKEFEEKLKEKAFADKYYEHESIVYLADIDNLVKEMVGDTE